MNKFNFIEIDKNLLPDTKGRRIDGHRFYEIEGKNYPSVTTVLNIRKSEGLKQWRNNVGNEVANWEMRRAANRGKATHTLVEEYLKGETPSERGVLPLGLFKLLKPYVDQINNVHCLETIMYSHKLTIAGQVDCVAEYNGELSVIDFKTANADSNGEEIVYASSKRNTKEIVYNYLTIPRGGQFFIKLSDKAIKVLRGQLVHT